MSFAAAAVSIRADNQTIVSLANEEEAQQVLEQFKSEYGQVEEGEKLLYLAFEQQVKIVPDKSFTGSDLFP